MKYFFIFFLVLALAVTSCFTASSQDKSVHAKPNILLIFADDLGYMDCGFTGSKIFETPNIDALAKKGMVFKNAYAAAGNCAPSRASLLSGKLYLSTWCLCCRKHYSRTNRINETCVSSQ